jgi:hypothetical protein
MQMNITAPQETTTTSSRSVDGKMNPVKATQIPMALTNDPILLLLREKPDRATAKVPATRALTVCACPKGRIRAAHGNQGEIRRARERENMSSLLSA